MVEENIRILIEAQDNATKAIENLNKSVTNLSDKGIKNLTNQTANLEKENQNLLDVFKTGQVAMLNLGQAVQNLHNIFEIQQRKTIALENAQDRLENAQIRLKQATYDLATAQNKLIDIEEEHSKDSVTLGRARLKLEQAQQKYNSLIKGGLTPNNIFLKEAELDVEEATIDVANAERLAEKKTKELAQATQDLKDKQDAITISNNMVERSQRALNMAIGNAKWMYVDMGLQLVSAVGNMGSFLINAQKLTGALGVSGGLGGAITGLTATIGTGGLLATAGLGGALLGLFAIMKMFPAVESEEMKKLKAYATGIDEIYKNADKASRALLDLIKAEIIQKETQLLVGGGIYGAGTKTDIGKQLNQDTKEWIDDLNKTNIFTGKTGWQNLLENLTTYAVESNNTIVNSTNALIEKYDGDGNNSLTQALNTTSMEYPVLTKTAIDNLQKIINKTNEIPLKITTIHETVEITSKGSASSLIGNKQYSSVAKKETNPIKELIEQAKGRNYTPVGDFVLRPNGQVLKTSPNDTIIGTKNPGSLGTSIIINIENLSGFSPEEISRALAKELNRKISL